MRSRHLFLLASLAALAAGLWVVPSGLALRKPVIQQVFGPKLVRLEAIERTPINGSTDWRIDRGAIVSVSSTQLTLREADGRIQAVSLASTTEVVRLGRIVSVARLAPHGNALVTWRANGAAQVVAVGRLPTWLRQTIVHQLVGPRLVRLEAFNNAAVAGSNDWRVDRGVITSVNSTQLTLREADGRLQAVPLSSATRVIYGGRQMPLSSLSRRWRVLVTWPASGAAQSVDVERIKGQGRR
jgi:hypothetical protein